jgi:bacterioferritin
MKEVFRKVDKSSRESPADHIAEIRKRARANVEDGAVTEGYRADRQVVLKMLNESLATEIVCVLRYKRHYYMASGIHAQTAATEFLDLAERIVQLGGEPDLNPDTLTARSHAEYVEGKTVMDMLRENLVAERIAIESYREFVGFLGADDSTTRRLIEEILATEEEHADDMKTLMERFQEV